MNEIKTSLWFWSTTSVEHWDFLGFFGGVYIFFIWYKNLKLQEAAFTSPSEHNNETSPGMSESKSSVSAFDDDLIPIKGATPQIEAHYTLQNMYEIYSDTIFTTWGKKMLSSKSSLQRRRY